MTRKHFRAIAMALYSIKPDDEGSEGYGARMDAWFATCIAICRAISPFSPSFDRNKFTRVCTEGK